MENEKPDLPPTENDDELPWAMYRKKKEEEYEKEMAENVPDEIPEITESDDEAYGKMIIILYISFFYVSPFIYP